MQAAERDHLSVRNGSSSLSQLKSQKGTWNPTTGETTIHVLVVILPSISAHPHMCAHTIFPLFFFTLLHRGSKGTPYFPPPGPAPTQYDESLSVIS